MNIQRPCEISSDLLRNVFLEGLCSLYLFSRYIRMFCRQIVRHPVFEAISLVVIVFNSIFLAFVDPNDDSNTFQTAMDEVFLILYTIEMALKIFALGFFFNKGAYLRDVWNVLDFVIVVTAYLPYIQTSNGVNLKGLRSLRVLRPLRSISSVKALRLIIVSLIRALPLLRDLILILLLLFLVFAIAGTQLFAGLLKRRCFMPESGRPYLDQNGNQMLCGYSDCPSGFTCGKMIANPDFDVSNFDNIASSLIVVFQIVTMEGWTTIMVYLETTYTPIAIAFCVALVFIGGFFLLNIFLAVIKAVFTTSSQHKKIGEDLTFEEKFQEMRTNHKEALIKQLKLHRDKRIEFNKIQILQSGELRKIDGKIKEEKKREKERKKSKLADYISRLRRAKAITRDSNNKVANENALRIVTPPPKLKTQNSELDRSPVEDKSTSRQLISSRTAISPVKEENATQQQPFMLSIPFLQQIQEEGGKDEQSSQSESVDSSARDLLPRNSSVGKLQSVLSKSKFDPLNPAIQNVT